MVGREAAGTVETRGSYLQQEAESNCFSSGPFLLSVLFRTVRLEVSGKKIHPVSGRSQRLQKSTNRAKRFQIVICTYKSLRETLGTRFQSDL